MLQPRTMRRHDQGTMKPLLSFTTLRGAKGPCRGSGSGPGRTHAPDQALVAHRHASKALSVELRHAASIKVGVAPHEPPLVGDEGGEHADRQVHTHDGLAPQEHDQDVGQAVDGFVERPQADVDVAGAELIEEPGRLISLVAAEAPP